MLPAYWSVTTRGKIADIWNRLIEYLGLTEKSTHFGPPGFLISREGDELGRYAKFSGDTFGGYERTGEVTEWQELRCVEITLIKPGRGWSRRYKYILQDKSRGKIKVSLSISFRTNTNPLGFTYNLFMTPKRATIAKGAIPFD